MHYNKLSEILRAKNTEKVVKSCGREESMFNQFLNEQRLNYVTIHLECSDESITDICMNAGFESQRTFNRVFRERYRMTPREYRILYKEKYLREEQT